MSFKDRMKVQVSDAEIKLDIKLQVRKIRLERQKQICLWKTTADFYAEVGTKRFAIFLDSDKVHVGKVQDRDERIDEALERQHITVLRYRYTCPISEAELNRIADEIEAKVKGRVTEV